MQQNELIPHLFRSEFSKIVSVLCNQLGLGYLDIAEDIASDTFLAAMETWPYHGPPPNPQAWLYAVAGNKLKNHFHRNALFKKKVLPVLSHEPTLTEAPDFQMTPQIIKDSQLQMLFTVCHPAIAAEAQIGLALRLLCGFGIQEIAHALLTGKETINKRLYRARQKLKKEQIRLELPPASHLAGRLNNVLTTLYLLFNEGYYSESQEKQLQPELCTEAMRLAELLLENELTDQPPVHAFIALMCFHISRFPAREGSNGEMILYENQDQDLWDESLISLGSWHLNKASTGDQLTRFHLEAGIAYWFAVKSGGHEKWEQILQLHNHLLVMQYSPVAALNRTYALSKVKGKAAALEEALMLNLEGNRFYHMLLGELYSGADTAKARENFRKAALLTKNPGDISAIQETINRLKD